MPSGSSRLAGSIAFQALRILRSVYFYEWWLLGMVAGVHLLFVARGLGWMAWTLGVSIAAVWPLPLYAVPAGMALVGLWEGARGGPRAGLARCVRVWKTAAWWWMTLRIWAAIILTTHIYIWLKLYMPLLNGRMLDPWVWNLEERVFFGYSPNRFILELFHQPWTLLAVDWSYPKVFLGGLYAGIILFPVLLSDRWRAACVTSYVLLWTLGGWLHVLLPAMGPCYWYPSIWEPSADWLRESFRGQAALLSNYRELTMYRFSPQVAVNPLYGIAAIPSMHNASQALLAFWTMRLNRPAGLLVWGSVALLFLGSVITGWHYLTDGVAGILLAAGVYAFVRRRLADPPTGAP